MTQIRKVHDKFIRDLMSRKQVVRDFLRNYLDKELLELLDSTVGFKKDTFVDQEPSIFPTYFTNLNFVTGKMQKYMF